MGAIYLIRHGQASFGQKNYDKLSATGERQALRLGAYLKEVGIELDRVYSGTLERQIRTAELALTAAYPAGLGEREVAFNEFDHEGVTRAHVIALAAGDPLVADFIANKIDRLKHFQKVFEKVVTRWVSDQHPVDGIESWPDFRDRVWQGLQRVIQETGRSKNIAIFTSGGPITAILHQVLKTTPEAAFEMNWAIANGSITKLMYNDERISLSYFNHYSYLKQGTDRSLMTYR